MGGWGVIVLAALSAAPRNELTLTYRDADRLFGGSSVQHVIGSTHAGKYQFFGGMTRVGKDSPGLPLQSDETFAGIKRGDLAAAIKVGDAQSLSVSYDGRLGGTLTLERVGEGTDLTPLYADELRGYAQVRWQVSPSFQLQASGGKQATPELKRGTLELLKPATLQEKLLGYETIYDRELGMRSPQDLVSASITYARNGEHVGIALSSGKQLDFLGDSAPFTGLDLDLEHDGTRFDGKAIVSTRQHDLYHEEYESRVKVEGQWRIGRGGFGLGAYSQGMHTELLDSAVSSVRGAAIDATMPAGESELTGFLLIDQDVGMDQDTARLGASLKRGSSEYIAGTRIDSVPNKRFNETSVGYFAGFRREGRRLSIDAMIGTQPGMRDNDDQLYGSIVLSARR